MRVFNPTTQEVDGLVCRARSKTLSYTKKSSLRNTNFKNKKRKNEIEPW